MGRGYIYNVEPEEYADGLGMCEEDFYERLGALNVDYVRDENGEDAAFLAHEFLGDLSRICTTREGPDGYLFIPDEQSAGKYFAGRPASMKEMVAGLTLQDFCDGSRILYDIRNLAEDTYGDCVYTGGVLYTLDRFIRCMKPGKKYRINTDTVIYMH